MAWRKLKLHCKETGYTEEAVYSKIKRRDWPEGIIWIKAPDGSIQISEEGYQAWVEGRVPVSTKVSGQRRIRQSKSTSTTSESAASPASKASPPPLTLIEPHSSEVL